MAISVNRIEELQDLYDDIWKCDSLYNVGQLAYILKNQGDSEMADALIAWKERIETMVAGEWEAEPYAEESFS